MPTHEEHLADIATTVVREAAKSQAINDNLPSWAQVEAYLDGLGSLAEAKVALKKIARVVYWIAKNRAD